MNLEGNWIFTQKWNGQSPYKFGAKLSSDGTIEVDGGYFGTWTVLGSSNQLALAIANFSQQSITSYSGNVAGPSMGGEMTGGAPGQSVFKGVWSATLVSHDEAPQGELRAPGQS